MSIRKTSLKIDFDILDEAAEILKTRSLTETVNQALKEVVDRNLRKEFVRRLSSGTEFNWESTDQAWGGDH